MPRTRRPSRADRAARPRARYARDHEDPLRNALDIRFPTSLELDASDAMNEAPDYSAAYVILRTDDPGGLEGHGLTFTSGRGIEPCVAAIGSLAPLVVGRSLADRVARPSHR